MLDTRDHIELHSQAIERGYKSCRVAVNTFFKGHLWPASNLPGPERRAIDTLLFNLMRTIDLFDLESVSGLSLDVWHEIRDDLSDAFRDQCSSVELAALVDSCRRFKIPKQYLFDPLRGADLWIRNHKFDTFDELEAFCSFVGGSTMAAAAPVLGIVEPDHELAAIQCGKAIMLTQILANCVNDMKQNKVFFALEDLQDCEVDVPRLKLRRPSQSFSFLVGLYVSRIEQLFHAGGQFVQYLDYDGQRTIKTLLALHWKMLMNMKIEPECILTPDGVLNRREQLTLKSRHLLGMESPLAIIPDQPHPH
jgi:phytoene synthase